MAALKVLRGKGQVFVDESPVGIIGYSIELTVDQAGNHVVRGIASTTSMALVLAQDHGGELELESGGRVKFRIDHYDDSTSSIVFASTVPGLG